MDDASSADDVRRDRRQPRVLPGPPGQERPRGDDRGPREGRRTTRSSPGPEETKYGAVETRAESRDLRRPVPAAPATRSTASSSRCPTSATSAAIADTLRLAGLNVPVLVQATPDTPSQMTIEDRRDSFCGKMSACNNLKQYGIRYSLTTLHTEAPDLAEFARGSRLVPRRLPRGQGACAACASAPSARGRRRSTRCATARSCSRRTGISVEPIDLSEILGRIDRLNDDDAAVQAKLAAIQAYVPTGERARRRRC